MGLRPIICYIYRAAGPVQQCFILVLRTNIKAAGEARRAFYTRPVEGRTALYSSHYNGPQAHYMLQLKGPQAPVQKQPAGPPGPI